MMKVAVEQPNSCLSGGEVLVPGLGPLDQWLGDLLVTRSQIVREPSAPPFDGWALRRGLGRVELSRHFGKDGDCLGISSGQTEVDHCAARGEPLKQHRSRGQLQQTNHASSV